MRLRDAIPDDLNFLLETERRSAALGFVHADDVCTHERQMSDPDYAYYTIEEGDKLAGYVILRGLTSSGCCLELKRVVIAGPGRGLGSQVLRAIIEKAFGEFRAHRLWLDVFEGNDRARHVYRSAGFVEESNPREYIKNGERQRSLVVMSMLEGEHRQNFD